MAEDKPVWDVATHGPIEDEKRDRYQVVGEPEKPAAEKKAPAKTTEKASEK